MEPQNALAKRIQRCCTFFLSRRQTLLNKDLCACRVRVFRPLSYFSSKLETIHSLSSENAEEIGIIGGLSKALPSTIVNSPRHCRNTGTSLSPKYSRRLFAFSNVGDAWLDSVSDRVMLGPPNSNFRFTYSAAATFVELEE